jgi:hypothetical protein
MGTDESIVDREIHVGQSSVPLMLDSSVVGRMGVGRGSDPTMDDSGVDGLTVGLRTGSRFPRGSATPSDEVLAVEASVR